MADGRFCENGYLFTWVTVLLSEQVLGENDCINTPEAMIARCMAATEDPRASMDDGDYCFGPIWPPCVDNKSTESNICTLD